MSKAQDVRNARARRHRSVRRKVQGTTERPRLNVFRSLHHMYAQIIDDSVGRTLISASTLEKEITACATAAKGRAGAHRRPRLGRARLAKGVTPWCSTRCPVHGRVKAGGRGARGRLAVLAPAAPRPAVTHEVASAGCYTRRMQARRDERKAG